VLFLTSNGTGLGHVTRLLAVARRCPRDVEPIFVTLSQAIGAIEQCGYPVEYVPSPIYADVDGRRWNAWFAARLRQIVAYYRPRAVVFDGSSTYEGLSMAVAPDPACRMIWIRRAMWRHEQDNRAVIERQKHFDLVIEPGDIADSVDRGETTRHRHMVVQVDPIRLLDDQELIDRARARAGLDLDPDRPAVLIQVGSGSNRDIATIIDHVLAGCSRHPELQPVIAEWLIASRPLDYWPGVRRLRGYPNSRYFNAFDFTVSATGYNSFNEIISLGLPAIFVANEHMEMDDQEARARFAEAQGAAFHVGERHTEEIGDYIDAMMAESTRSLLRFNALRIARPNGAEQAAELVARFLQDR
jgi:UDP:flavonoid glycosyltransferase YjiC (YdhE family)